MPDSPLKLPCDSHGEDLQVPLQSEGFRQFTSSSSFGSCHAIRDIELTFGARILTDFGQYQTILYTVAVVHLQHAHCCASFGCDALDLHIDLYDEMVVPHLVAGMNEPGDLLRLRVNTREVVAFMCITLVTGQA
jgi:hypothetical protein